MRVGTVVRIPFSGRRVRGWVLDTDVEPPEGLTLSAIAKVSGHGPDADTIDLCRWVAWRWSARLATVMRVATPDKVVQRVAPVQVRPARSDAVAAAPAVRALRDAVGLGPGAHVVQVPPTAEHGDLAVAAATLGQVLVLTPDAMAVAAICQQLRRAGAAVARWPFDWAAAGAGATVVGGRGAVFAPMPALAAIVVLDEHDEALQNEGSPSWNAREIAVERARRAGVPCVLVSPCPSLQALGAQDPDTAARYWRSRPRFDLDAAPGALGADLLRRARGETDEEALPAPAVRLGRNDERAGWARLIVIDRRGDDTARGGLFSSRFVEMARDTARAGERVLCVLNRTGRARFLVCRSCGTVADCEACGASMYLDDDSTLGCARCRASRPAICMECGSTALSKLRPGVTRAREELEALVREPVLALTAASTAGRDGDAVIDERVVIGTIAALHRVRDAELVAFLDFDQELLAPRHRAAEEAFAMLATASRRVGGRAEGARVLVQTRQPEHEVIQAALHADPSRVAVAEAQRRRMLLFPPAATIAVVGHEAGAAYVERVGHPLGIDVLGPDDGQWMLRSTDSALLLDHLAGVQRPPGRLRLQVDPMRLR